MNWEKAESASIDPHAFYLVKDNGGEWRDFDLSIIKGQIVTYRLRPEIVRGRPVLIVKITDPFTITSPEREPTEAMILAASEHKGQMSYSDVWRVMFDAAKRT